MALLSILPTVHTFPFTADGKLPTQDTSPTGVGEEFGSPEFWWKMIISTVFVLLGGVFSGCVHHV
jgi:metal transporter CNNM